MNRLPTLGFQKPISAPSRAVGLAVLSTEGRTIGCSCGWGFKHDREKVREDAADRHLDKKHAGRGIRL